MNRRLYRSPEDRVLAGVAGGMAETYDLDPALVRVGWALLILVTGGVFLLLYIVMALVVPLRPDGVSAWAAEGPDGGPSGPGAPAGPGASTGAPGSHRARFGPPYGHRYRSAGDASGPIVIGLLLIIVGGFFLARQFIPALNLGLLWPVVVICGGVLLILAAFARPRSTE